jgi:hypothetical protein
MPSKKKQSTESAVREIRRRTRRKFAPEEKVRIVLEGLRGPLQVDGALNRGTRPLLSSAAGPFPSLLRCCESCCLRGRRLAANNVLGGVQAWSFVTNLQP